MGKILSFIFAGLFFAVKIVYWLLKAIIILLGKILVFFGLYIPGVYLLLGAVLTKFNVFSFSALDTRLNLFVLGLILCTICALIIAIRNLIVKPFATVLKKFGEDTKKEFVDKRPKMKKNPKDKPRREESPYPLVYRSQIYPDITVHEYEDRFDLYRDDKNGKIKFFKTEYK